MVKKKFFFFVLFFSRFERLLRKLQSLQFVVVWKFLRREFGDLAR
jgi:hypothetical protein